MKVFYIAGETIFRSHRELILYIQENGGIVSYDMDTSVDYIVAGKNSEKDVEKAKGFGIRVVREQELPEFFGLKAREIW
jgi:NAD-dependent DNA ligase